MFGTADEHSNRTSSQLVASQCWCAGLYASRHTLARINAVVQITGCILHHHSDADTQLANVFIAFLSCPWCSKPNGLLTPHLRLNCAVIKSLEYTTTFFQAYIKRNMHTHPASQPAKLQRSELLATRTYEFI